MTIIRRNFSKEGLTKEFEVNNLPSQTVPNQALTIPQLIERYAKGLPLGGSKVPVYEDEYQQQILQGRHWKSYDLSEQHEILQNLVNEVKAYNSAPPKGSNKKEEDNPPVTE